MDACLWSFPLNSNLIFHRPKLLKSSQRAVLHCTIQNLAHFSNLFGNLKTDTHAESKQYLPALWPKWVCLYVYVYVLSVCLCVRSTMQRQNLNINIHLCFCHWILLKHCSPWRNETFRFSVRWRQNFPKHFKYAFIRFDGILDFHVQCTCTLCTHILRFWI